MSRTMLYLALIGKAELASSVGIGNVSVYNARQTNIVWRTVRHYAPVARWRIIYLSRYRPVLRFNTGKDLR
jgi:hypothetical protein